MGLGVRRSVTSCFCVGGCEPGTYPFKRYWVSSFAPFAPFEPNRILFDFVQEDEFSTCTWNALVNPWAPFGGYELRKFVIIAGGIVTGHRWQVTANDGFGLNGWSFDNIAPVIPPDMVYPEGPGSCSSMKYTLDNIVWGANFTAVLEPAYPDACDDSDRITKVQTKPLAPF